MFSNYLYYFFYFSYLTYCYSVGIFINSEGVLINKLNESEAEYPKSTEIPIKLINNSTTGSNGSILPKQKATSDISEDSIKHGLYYLIYSEEFKFLMILLLVVCLCCCCYFLWRYSKLPSLPLKSESDCSFTKEIFSEKSRTEKLCFGSNV